MSFTLISLGSDNYEFRGSFWNWKTVLEIIKSFDIVSEGKLRQMNDNVTGVTVSPAEAGEIGERIKEEILPRLVPNKRIYADLSITDKPDDGTIYKDADEQWKNFSANHDWLEEFAEFCAKSKGFQVY